MRKVKSEKGKMIKMSLLYILHASRFTLHFSLFILLFSFFFSFLSCSKAATQAELPNAASPFASFREIPGVTAQEIAAVESLRRQYGHFVYGMNYKTIEAFPVYSEQDSISGEYTVGGYAARLCEWLTVLFGIPFRPTFYDWNTLVSGLESGEVDFTGDLTISDERRKTHFMTGTIAERTLSTFKIAGGPSIAEIAKSRPPRLVFVYGSAMVDSVREVADYAFEPVFVSTHAEAYRVIKSGEADAFLTMNIVEPDFDIYGDVVIETFYPLIFGSAALSTRKADLEPVISVVQKALENGGTSYLSGLYSLGRRDYLKNKFFEGLDPEEREYIQRNPVVKIATESDSYPLSFYNRNDDELQGIAFDVMSELKLITGLSFEVVSPLNSSFLDLTDMVESGEASMITAMMRSRERERRFLLPETAVLQEFPILVSKSEFPNIQFNELSNMKVGIVRGTLHAELFKRWFPNNRTYREYDNLDGAFNALVRGEVDMFMAMSNYLLSLINYKELIGYKANVAFDNNFDITFGFNKDKTVLFSIVDKAMKLIDLETISEYWTRRTYDYRAKVAEGRLPWLIGVTALSLIVLSLILVMFYRSRNQEKQLAKEVMEKTSTLTAILDTAPDLIFVKDLNSRYIRCNKSFESLMGCSCETLIGKGDAEGLNASPEVAAAFVAEDKKIFDSKQMVSFEDYILASDGTKVLFETIKSPLVIDGKMIGLVGVARDITQRKAAEEELIRQHSLMDTVNAAAAVLLVPDTDGGVNAIDRSMEMVCKNLDADRVFLWKNFYKGDDKLHYKQVHKWMRPEYNMGDDLLEYTYEEAMPAWKDLLFAGKSINGPLDTLPGYDSEIFSFYTLQSILIVPLFLKGEYWGFVSFDDCHSRRSFSAAYEHILRSWGMLVVGAVQRDRIMRDLEYAVAEAKRASSEAMKAYAEAENASEAKSRFIANMNHEMRTPMNVIVGLTDLMLEEDKPVNIKETLQKINTAGNTLMGLISDVLDISKVEAGKMELMPVQYDTASLLNDIIGLNMIRAEDKPIVFKLDINENLPFSLFGDDLRVKQILNNLLSNAFKYTREGTVTFGVGCRREGRRHGDDVWISFYVSDTGIGIRGEDMKKLFSDYNQVDTRANREIEGTGLGLSITRKFVELMDGEITVESEYGKGTTFRALIRQGYVTDKLIGKETVESLSNFRYLDKKKQAQKKLSRSDLSYARVLVVDDFPTNLDVAAGMLRKYKMQVDCVMTGQKSIDLIAAGEPVYGAIFMDHMMPGMDGVEAAKAIRALGTEYAQNIPIIALTANAVAESEQMFLGNGFNAFLPKPFNVMSLDAVIQRWVRDKSRE